MKSLTAALTVLLAGGALAAPPADRHSAWRWEQPVAVPAPGIVRLELPDATLDAAQATLADLRVLAPDGVATPWLLDNLPPPQPSMLEAQERTVRLIEAAPNIEAATVLECGIGSDLPVAAIIMRSPAREFIKSAAVEGTADGENWQLVCAREVVFRQADGAARMRIPLPPKPWRKLRLTLSDARSAPIPVTGAGLELAVAERRETQTREISVRAADPGGPGTTRLTLDLGAANLHLEAITLNVSSPVFSRRYTLAVAAEGTAGRTAAATLASGMLYRVVGEQGAVTAQLTIPVHRRVPARQLVLTLEDRDSPPLTVDPAATATTLPTLLEFHAATAGGWRLLYGNPRASMPDYDLTPLRTALAGAPGQRLTPGAPQARPEYAAPTALPGIDPAGATIELAAWSRRCAITVPGTGAVVIELQPAQLAATRDDLGDLRLVQDGRQLPYLLETRPIERSLPCGLEQRAADPKRPAVSRWIVRPAVPELPTAALVLSSSTPVFSRSLILGAVPGDERRRADSGWRTRAMWTRANGDTSDFRFDLANHRLPALLELETDNGDNPPLVINGARTVYQTRVLAAKIIAAKPVALYYGNPQATAPSYDLELVRAELLAADKHQATLGGEEILKPGPTRPWQTSAGSPWLWAALALVVAVLLIVVAKLLPKPAGK